MLTIVIVLSVVYEPQARDTVLLSIPLAALVVCLVAGIALAVASANAVFRDVEHVVAALLLPWFFLTPVLYSLDRVPGAKTHPWFERLMHWGNFMTPAVESLREPLFFGNAPWAASRRRDQSVEGIAPGTRYASATSSRSTSGSSCAWRAAVVSVSGSPVTITRSRRAAMRGSTWTGTSSVAEPTSPNQKRNSST